MRRDNSKWVTSFVTEAGEFLKNHDDFAFVELDDFACWVLADGIDHADNSESAKIVVEQILQKFTESPTMSKSRLSEYVKDAHYTLQAKSIIGRLKASVIIIVTDYVNIRWVSSGNARMHLIRNGKLLAKSKDQSFLQHQIDNGKAPNDESVYFEERNNLTSYLGISFDFEVVVSDKVRMQENDCIILSTVGFWEHINQIEIIDAVEASKEPAEAVDTLEDFLLSSQPREINNYSIVAIYVNKIYEQVDNTWKIIKRILIIAIPILIMSAIFSIFLYIRYNNKMEHIDKRESYEQNGDEYIAEKNFDRALVTYQDATKESDEAGEEDKLLAKKEKITQLVVDGDNFVDEEKYDEAINSYNKAIDECKKDPELEELFDVSYIEEKLNNATSRKHVGELIALGDMQVEAGDYEGAQASYDAAKSEAINSDFNEAITDINMKQAELDTKIHQQSVDAQASQADQLVAQGDAALEAGDIEGAIEYYEQAQAIYSNIQMSDKVTSTGQKITDAKVQQKELQKEQEQEEQVEEEAQALEQ